MIVLVLWILVIAVLYSFKLALICIEFPCARGKINTNP